MISIDDVGRLIVLLYKLECNDGCDRVIMEDDFQIHKLYPNHYFESTFIDDIYPIYYYRDKYGNEVFVNSKNEVIIKLKDKKTISFGDIDRYFDEKKYIEDTVNYLKSKILVDV